jgi:hypothetical protein
VSRCGLHQAAADEREEASCRGEGFAAAGEREEAHRARRG